MDPRTFDRLVAAAAARPSRRAALRLLAGGLLGGVLAKRGVAPVAAQRPDGDGDGLFDDDERYVYGTDPYTYDTDGDGVGDGPEVYYGTDPLVNESYVEPAPEPAPPAPEDPVNGLQCPAGNYTCSSPTNAFEPYCADIFGTDSANCGGCGRTCPTNTFCLGGACEGFVLPDFDLGL